MPTKQKPTPIIPKKTENPTSKIEWLPALINFGGAIVGIVLTAIGGVMFLNAALKLYVFQWETSPYFNAREMCDNGYYAKPIPPVTEKGEVIQPEEKSQADIEECIQKRTEAEKISFKRQKQEDFINGTAFLVVGGFFWILHRRKKLEKKK